MRKLPLFALSLLLPIGTGGVTLAQETALDDLKVRHTTSQQVRWNVTIVWDRIDDFLDRRDDIELISFDRENRTLTAERSGVNHTGWVTCDTTDLSTVQVDMRFDLTVAQAGPGTDVTVSPYFLADDQPLPDCRPTGEFSQMLFRAL